MPKKIKPVKPVRRKPLVEHITLGQAAPGTVKQFVIRQERVCAKMVNMRPQQKSMILMTNEDKNDVCLMYGNCDREEALHMCLGGLTLITDMSSDDENLEALEAILSGIDDALERIWNTMATTSITDASGT